jgi:hypothetical protein
MRQFALLFLLVFIPLNSLWADEAKDSGAPPLPSKQVNAPTTSKTGAGYPFRGKLVEVNAAGNTIRIGKSTYLITSETKITRDGSPAPLSDAKVGEPVSGYARKMGEGPARAASLKLGGNNAPTPLEKTSRGSNSTPRKS